MYRGCLTGIPVDDLHCSTKRRLSSLKAFFVSGQRDERNTEVNIFATGGASSHGDWPLLGGTARIDTYEVLAVWAVKRGQRRIS